MHSEFANGKLGSSRKAKYRVIVRERIFEMKKLFYIVSVVSMAVMMCAIYISCTSNKNEKKGESAMAKIYYQGHGSLRLTSSAGTVVYIDPFTGDGYDVPADLILVTHQHPDHNKIELVTQKENCIVLQNFDMLPDGKTYQTKTVGDIKIEAVQAYNKNHKKEECVGYIVTVDGKQIYFSGDTSTTEQMPSFAARSLDYAFLPCDGFYNMDIPEAISCAETIKAKHTVPIHIKPGALFDADRAATFKTPSALIVAAGTEIELQ